MLVVPGVNPSLPIAAAPELLFGLVIHEGAHGLLARAGDIEVESVGLFLLAVVPAGAYVLPAGMDGSEDDHEAGDRPAWARFYAAGPAANLVGAAVCFLALLAVLGSIAPVAGVAVGLTVAMLGVLVVILAVSLLLRGEYSLGQSRRHGPVRRVHDLAHLQITGHRAEYVGVGAREPTFRQPVEHPGERVLGACFQVGTDTGGTERGALTPVLPTTEGLEPR